MLADRAAWFCARERLSNRGHPSSNLGTVELTVALHHVFNTRKTVWCGTWATKPIRTRS